MAQCGLIHIYPTGFIRQWANPDKVRRGLRRTDVNHIESALDHLGIAVVIRVLEPRLLCRTVDFKQSMLKIETGVVLFHVFHQCRDILLDTEQYGTAIVELDIDIPEHPLAIPPVRRQVHRFLGRAGAFNGHGRLGEQGSTGGHVFHQFPSIWGQIETVVGGDAIAAQGIRQPFDGIPVQFYTRRHY